MTWKAKSEHSPRSMPASLLDAGKQEKQSRKARPQLTEELQGALNAWEKDGTTLMVFGCPSILVVEEKVWVLILS